MPACLLDIQTESIHYGHIRKGENIKPSEINIHSGCIK